MAVVTIHDADLWRRAGLAAGTRLLRELPQGREAVHRVIVEEVTRVVIENAIAENPEIRRLLADLKPQPKGLAERLAECKDVRSIRFGPRGARGA